MLGPLLLLLSVSATPAAAQTPEAQQAAGIALNAVNAGAAACGATVDTARTRSQPTDPVKTTAFRPAGFDVTVFGSAASKYSARNDFESQWLVADGKAYPRNMAAARLAVRCGPPPSNPGAPLDWHRLTHLEPSTGRIQIGRLGFDGAVLNAALRKQLGDAGPMEESQAPVWDGKCKSGVQYVIFSRNVDLLGPPESLRVWINGASAGLRRSPINAVGLFINGRQVAIRTTRGILDQDLGEDVRSLIRFGSNRFAVVARKEKTGSCNRKNGKRQVGISFMVQGKQAWKTAASRPPVQSQGNVLASIPYTLTNLGPSVLLEPVFAIDAAVRQFDRVTVGPNASGAGATCATIEARLTAVCGLEPMQPGESKTIGVSFAAGAPSRPVGSTTGEFTSWQMHWDFLGATGYAPGSYCIPPGGKTDCSTIGG